MVALLIESWIWWSLVIIVAGSRFVGRRLVLGSFRNYQIDDYTMAVILCFYTTLIVTINIVRHTSSNLLPPGYNMDKLTPQNIREREYGSKLILVVEQCQCVTIWGAKLCLIALYLRLTTMRKENIAIKALAVYVVGSFIIMDILYFGVWCQPFHEYWAVPTDSAQCDAATNHLITNAVFNLSSDCLMLAIGLPMFLRLNLPWQKKVPLVMVFSLGVFVILAAILNKVYSFTDPFGSLWTYWYVRESSTALLVANLPFVWTIWRRAIGITSITGISHGNDTMRSDTLDRRQSSPTTLRKESMIKRMPTIEDSFATDPSSSSGQRKRSSGSSSITVPPKCVTLEEVLSDGHSLPTTSHSTAGAPEPNPLTHPMLYYTQKLRPPEARDALSGCSSIADGSGLEEGIELRESQERFSSRRTSSDSGELPAAR